MIGFFIVPILSLIVGLSIVAGMVWMKSASYSLLIQSLMTVILLSVLEISLSFDNAVVNATVIKKMSLIWKKRFLSWGMIIAVFGMRFVFPLVIVSITGGVTLIESLNMALSEPQKYSDMMLKSHLAVSSFGGAFLMMVFLHFFMNEDKDSHWIHFIEKPFQKASSFKGSEFIIALLVIIGIFTYISSEAQQNIIFLTSALWGILVYLIVHGVSDLLGSDKISHIKFLSSGFGLFLYLEVLDASFSFDGVVGAFAISTDLIIIMVGLSVGAFFVRGLTLYLVEKETLEQFAFLEHGAFYALGALAFFMLFDIFFHFSEVITALTGAGILLISIIGSIYEKKKIKE
jgi:hypothetical protein